VLHTLTTQDFSRPSEVEEAAEESQPEVDTAEDVSSQDFLISGLINTLFMLGFVAVVTFFLTTGYGASNEDLGLPVDKSQLVRDLGIGAIACLASLLPIYAVQIVLFMAFDPQIQHPLIEELVKNHTPAMLLVGFVTAVVAAPIYEEFTFRLLLQGWLERIEDEKLRYEPTARVPATASESFLLDDSELASSTGLQEPMVTTQDVPESHYLSVLADQQQFDPPEKGLWRELPHGWLPIMISGFLFGLAHLGHGVAPIPLVIFGIVLGYMYQRTHRLVPCIVAHSMFNAYSMTLLWLQLGS